jgi:hypothetical protein
MVVDRVAQIYRDKAEKREDGKTGRRALRAYLAASGCGDFGLHNTANTGKYFRVTARRARQSKKNDTTRMNFHTLYIHP